jgi:hypothetical protein
MSLVRDPVRTRLSFLPGIAWALLALWCATAVVYGSCVLIETTVPARALTGHGSWHDPFPLGLGTAVWLLWLLATFNLAPAALLLGTVGLVRDGVGRLRRITVLAALIVGGAAAEFAAGSLTPNNDSLKPDFVVDERLRAVLVIVTALLVGAAGYRTLLVRRRAE